MSATTATAPATEPVPAVAPVVSDAPVVEPIAEVTPEAAAPETTAAPVEPTEEKVGKDEVKIEATPVSEGTLAYKAPGLLKSLLSSKKHFWLGAEPVAHDSLSRYIKEEKDEKIAHHNVAHASETGKGLLFFAKRAEDKSAPEGIINLADAVDLTKEPGDKFAFKVHGKKHEFHAPNRAEADGWVVAIETAITEAVAAKDTVAAGENYKSTHSKLGKGAVAAATTAGAAGAATTKDAVHDGTTPVETTATADKKEARSSSKGRSQSRKRASIFGGLIGKKDEKSVERANEKEAAKEVKEETKEAEKHEKAAEKEAKKEEKAEEKAIEAEQEAKFHENRKAEEVAAAVVAAPTSTEEAKVSEPTTAAPATETTKASKRSSVFGFFGKKSGEVPTTKDVSKDAPAVPAKDTPVASSTAPQLDPVDTTVPTETAVATETPAVATEAAVAEPESSSNPLSALENTPEAKAANKQKEGGDLFSFMKKKKAETEGSKAVDTTEGVAAAEKTEGTAASPTEKRRSSFFNSLGGAKKERASSPEGEKKSGLGGLFRKASKSQKPTTGPVTDSSAPPAIPATAETAAPAVAATEAPVAASTEAAPVAESVAKTELPTATEALPATEAAVEPAPAAAPATTTA